MTSILERNKNLEILLKEIQNSYTDKSNNDIEKSNDLFFEINKQIIWFSGLFLGAILAGIVSTDLVSKITNVQKILVIVSIFCLCLSIFFGIIQFNIEKKFYLDWGKLRDEFSKKFTDLRSEVIRNKQELHDSKVEELYKETFTKENSMKKSSNMICFYIQNLFLVLAVSMLIVITYLILFPV